MTVRTRFARDLAILLLVSACTRAEPAPSRSAQPGGAAADPEEDPTRFEAEIRAYEAADRANPPPLGGIVFVGSSSIKNWTDVAADFPGPESRLRGVHPADVVYYADRIMLPYHPRLVVLYAGDNDLTFES